MNSADENEKNGLLAESGSAAGNEELLSGDESAAVSGTPKRANEAVKELARLNPVKRLAVLEAVLFMASEPLKADELQEALGWPAALLQQDLLALADTFAGRGIELSCSGGAWRLTTAPDTAPWVERFLKVESRRRLSRAQLETLSVIAYRQPVTRADIENYRGVRSDRALSQLEDLNLIKSLGRSPLPGHPIQYGTTVDFLRYFGLNSLNELPEISLEAELFRRIYEPTEAKGKTRRAGSVSADAADSAASAPNGDGEEPGAETAAEAEGGEELDLDAPSAGLKKLLNKIKKRRLAEEREAAEKSEPERRG